ncbi:hypothetical protein FRB97_006065 [Tulasnella sp. 331]|nr:hypothetical protein FRB97_006065 [Tulasnella sp. 331]
MAFCFAAPHPLGLQEDTGLSSWKSSQPSPSAATLPQRVLAPLAPPLKPIVSPSGGRTKSMERPTPLPPTPPLTSNPFRRSTSQASNPSPFGHSHSGGGQQQLSGSAVADELFQGRMSPTSLPQATKVGRASSTPFISTNAVNIPPRAKKTSHDESSPTKNPFLALSRANSHGTAFPVVVPPLPPRKPTLPVLPPPRHPAPPPVPPPIARKPSHTYNASTSALIRQSLLAAKTAQKVSDGTLQHIKTMEVIKSSSGTALGGSLKERARTAQGLSNPDSSTSTPPLTVRSGTSPSTAPPSVSSNEGRSAPASIAASHAHTAPIPPPRPPPLRANSRSTSPQKPSPIKPTFIVASEPSESSPDSFASASSTRPTRSKSLHGSPSSGVGKLAGSAPTPPPRRRPESVQVATSPFAERAGGVMLSNSSASSSPRTLSRRSSTQPTPSPGQQHMRRKSQHSPPSSATGSVHGSATGRSTSPPHDPFSSFFSSVRQTTENMFGVVSGGGNGSGAGVTQSDGLQFHKYARKAEGGLAPGRGYISHRLGGRAGERLVNTKEDDGDDPDDDDPIERRASSGARSGRQSIDSNTPGMDTTDEPSQDPYADVVDWNQWERDDSKRFGAGPGIVGRSSSQPNRNRVGGGLGNDRDDEEEDEGIDELRKPQKVGDGWRRLG